MGVTSNKCEWVLSSPCARRARPSVLHYCVPQGRGRGADRWPWPMTAGALCAPGLGSEAIPECLTIL